MTYLEAVNRMLSFVGAGRVADPNVNHPLVTKARALLDQRATALMKRGWWFNRVYAVDHVPDAQGNITFGKNVLSFALWNPNIARTAYFSSNDPSILDSAAITRYPKLTKRGGRLFDAVRNSFTFEETMVLNINQELDWEDMPDSAQDYIVYDAGGEFVSDELSDTAKENKLNQKKDFAWTELRTEEINTSNTNVFDSPRVQGARRGRRPFSQTAGIRGRYP